MIYFKKNVNRVSLTHFKPSSIILKGIFAHCLLDLKESMSIKLFFEKRFLEEMKYCRLQCKWDILKEIHLGNVIWNKILTINLCIYMKENGNSFR